MRFCVMVPVLSMQTVWTAPKVSTACNWRIRTPWLLILLMPRAKLMVAAAGSPSGTAAAAREMDMRSISKRPYPPEKTHAENDAADTAAHEHQLVTQLSQLPFDGRFRRGDLSQERLKLADFRVRTRGDRYRQALPPSHQCTHERHVERGPQPARSPL